MRFSISASRRSVLIAAGVTLMVSTAGAEQAAPLTGDWGGPQVRLVLTDKGGTLELSCASASLDAPIHPDATGTFTATGRYEAFTGGPALADAPPATTPAQFSGRITGDTLQLSVHPKGDKTAQAYTLERGRRVKLIRCT